MPRQLLPKPSAPSRSHLHLAESYRFTEGRTLEDLLHQHKPTFFSHAGSGSDPWQTSASDIRAHYNIPGPVDGVWHNSFYVDLIAKSTSREGLEADEQADLDTQEKVAEKVSLETDVQSGDFHSDSFQTMLRIYPTEMAAHGLDFFRNARGEVLNCGLPLRLVSLDGGVPRLCQVVLGFDRLGSKPEHAVSTSITPGEQITDPSQGQMSYQREMSDASTIATFHTASCDWSSSETETNAAFMTPSRGITPGPASPSDSDLSTIRSSIFSDST